MSIGGNIKRLREQRGMLQGDLAKALGVAESTVSYWESDTKVPRMGKIEAMAELFGVLKSEIIEGVIADGTTLFAIYNRLSEEDKEKASSFIRYLAQEEMQDNPKGPKGR